MTGIGDRSVGELEALRLPLLSGCEEGTFSEDQEVEGTEGRDNDLAELYNWCLC